MSSTPPPGTSTPTPADAAGPAGGPAAGAAGRRGLGPAQLVMLVVAAAAPLASMLGNVPSGVLLGNGAGLPVMFAVAAVVVAALATGYLALVRDHPGADGFAAFVRVGLGAGWGLGAAYAITLAYAAGTVSLAVATGYFGSLMAAAYGLAVPWWALTAVALVLTAVLGRRAADLSAGVLVTFMAAEFALLLVLDVAVLAQRGPAAFDLTVFEPGQMFSGALGPALMTGFTSFIGVESAIIYTREARDPARSVPRATFAAIGVIAVFYVLTSWLIIGGIGVDQVLAQATAVEGDLVFGLSAELGGTALLVLMQVFFVTSALACLIALHNATARYARALADRGELPRALAVADPVHGAPVRASDVMVLVSALVVAVPAALGADPYIGLGTSLTGIFTVGIFGVQLLVGLSVVVHYRRRGDARVWRTLVVPGLGTLGVFVAVAAMVANYPVLTATDSPLVNALPVLLLAAVAAGPVVARLHAGRPAPADPAPQG